MGDKKQCDFIIKLLLIGDSGAGKTSLLMKYIVNTFSPTYITTIGIDFKIKYIQIDNVRIKLQIWDTAGQERFRTITRSYYRGSHGVVIVYDVTDRISFGNVEKWLNDIEQMASPHIVKILIGNKSDMINNRKVSTKEGKDLAKKHDIKFFETSANVGTNVDIAFDTLSRLTYSAIKDRNIVDTNSNIFSNQTPQPSKCC